MSGCSERWTAAVVLFALLVCVASPLPAVPLPATGVLDALTEPDGTAVSLKAVSVQKTASDPPHIVVSDACHDASPTPSEPPAASYRRNNTANRYVALVTDAAYHYLDDPYGGTEHSSLAFAGVQQALGSSGAHVFFSLWDANRYLRDNFYDGLNVNSGQFDDPVVTYIDEDRYPFTLLRQAMAQAQ